MVAPVVDGNIVDDDNNNEESDVVDISAPKPILSVLDFFRNQYTYAWFSSELYIKLKILFTANWQKGVSNKVKI